MGKNETQGSVIQVGAIMEKITFTLSVHSIRYEGASTRLIELRPPAGTYLPPVEAGAHIDVHISPTITRQYSLCNTPGETHRYIIGVALDPCSRGGSRALHEVIKEGDTLNIGGPRNHFELLQSEDHSVLIGGGIGITPLLSMALQLEAQQRTWSLHYAAKSADVAPLFHTISTLAKQARYGQVNVYFSQPVSQRMQVSKIMADAPKGSHFYCCGPLKLLDDFDACSEDYPSNHCHSERFSGDLDVAKGGYTIVLARTGKEIYIKEEQTILDALKAEKMNVTYACAEGVCGSCEVKVLEGTPDHRDDVLSESEKARNDTMMVCCSGAISKRLVLDL